MDKPAGAPLLLGVDQALVRRTQTARRLRSTFLSAELFTDPAWDMLLELFARELGEESISASEICAVAGVGASSARRWLEALEEKGLIERASQARNDNDDWIKLSAKGSAQMQRYFAAVATTSPPV